MANNFENDIYYVKKYFQKISFDLSKIKDLSKIYKAYNIATDESIIAYIKSSVFLVPLTMDGVIITDKGVYFQSSIFEAGQKNKLPFEELCKYVFSKEDEKASLEIVSPETTKVLWNGSIIGKNTIGDELLSFLTDMQERLMSEYPWAIRQRNDLVDIAIKLGKEEIKTCSLSKELRIILASFIYDKKYNEKVAPIIVERIYRRRGLHNVEEYISCLPEFISSNAIQKIKNDISTFIEDFITDLSDLSLLFDNNYLSEVLSNINAYTKNDILNTARLTAYISARLGKTEKFKEAQKIIFDENDMSEAFDLEYFKCRTTNMLMKSVFDSVNNANPPSHIDLFELEDCFGFNALHYAIILGKKSGVDFLLKANCYSSSGIPDAPDQAILDYGVIAQICGFDDIYDLYYKTSDYVKSQQKVFKSLNRRLKARQIQVTIQRKAESMHHQAMSQASRERNSEKYEEFKEKYYYAKELIKDTEAIINDIQMEIAELENELYDFVTQEVKTAKEVAEKLFNCDDEYIKLLITLIKSPDKISSILDSISSRMYVYGKKAFILSENETINLPYINIPCGNVSDDFMSFWKEETSETELENEVYIEKPYGDSWFSPKAHTDEKTLKEEYRNLAKIYHPDVAKTKESETIFKEINNERADILDTFE